MVIPLKFVLNNPPCAEQWLNYGVNIFVVCGHWYSPSNTHPFEQITCQLVKGQSGLFSSVSSASV